MPAQAIKLPGVGVLLDALRNMQEIVISDGKFDRYLLRDFGTAFWESDVRI